MERKASARYPLDIMKPVLKKLNLQRQLSLSHFLVTLLTALILALFVLLGYIIYFQTGLAARWVAYDAWAEADGLADIHFDKKQLVSNLSQDYMDAVYAPYWNEEDGLLEDAENVSEGPEVYSLDQILVLDAEANVVASNYQEVYPAGNTVDQASLPAFRMEWLEPKREIDYFNVEPLLRFAIQGDQHIGFAPIISDQNNLLGWVYLSYTNAPNAAFIGTTARNIGLAFIGATLIAVIVSSLVGRNLSKGFGQRLTALSNLSQSYAKGDFDRRIETRGQDEITQLATQMNSMAEQLQKQMLELKNLAEQNAKLAEEAKAFAVLEERNRLARDLHDAVKQQLFGLNLSVTALKSMHKKNPEKLEAQLDNITLLTSNALEEMDVIIKQLKPASLENKGLAQALRDLAEQWSEQTSIRIDVQVIGERELALEPEQALYRIAQEALQNVAKHSEASKVDMTLSYDVDEVKLSIHDNGQGFDMTRITSNSSGIKGMQERTEQLGGSFDVQTGEKGTGISISLPHAALSSTLMQL